MNTVYVDGVYIGKAKNPGQGLISDTDKDRIDIASERMRAGRVEDGASRLSGVPLEGLRA